MAREFISVCCMHLHVGMGARGEPLPKKVYDRVFECADCVDCSRMLENVLRLCENVS